MRSLYSAGVSVLGGDLPRARVKSANTAGYVLPDMSEASAKTLGDQDPKLMVNPGVEVDIVGPAAMNAHGVSYTPIQLTGQDDRSIYWVRSSSLAPILAAPVAIAPATPGARPSTSLFAPATNVAAGSPWWQYGLIALGVGVVGYGVYKIASGGTSAMAPRAA